MTTWKEFTAINQANTKVNMSTSELRAVWVSHLLRMEEMQRLFLERGRLMDRLANENAELKAQLMLRLPNIVAIGNTRFAPGTPLFSIARELTRSEDDYDITCSGCGVILGKHNQGCPINEAAQRQSWHDSAQRCSVDGCRAVPVANEFWPGGRGLLCEKHLESE